MGLRKTSDAVQCYKKASQMYLGLHKGRVDTFDVKEAMTKYKRAERLLMKELKGSDTDSDCGSGDITVAR